MGSFYFLRIFSVLPRPVSPLVNPPRGVYPQAPKTPPQAPETVNPCKHTPTNKSPGKRPTTPHNASRTQRRKQPNNPRRRTRQTPDTMHPHPRTTQCTHTHERHKPGTRSQAFKACHVHPGRLFLIMFYVYRAAVHARKSPGI